MIALSIGQESCQLSTVQLLVMIRSVMGCRGIAPTVEATGGSGLLPGAAPEVAGVPVCKVHHDDLHPSLQNPPFSFFPGSQTGST